MSRLSDQFVRVLPAGSELLHSTYQPDAIRREGIRPSRHGESGMGVYMTDDPEYAARMSHTTGEAPYRTTLKFSTSQDLRLLDRSTPEGEEHYRSMAPGSHDAHEIKAAMQTAGYHGVSFPTTLRGKPAPEIVVHDPAHLKLES